jgi:hypothetical protein
MYSDVQIKQLNIPIKIKIFEWNAGGLLSRIEVRVYCNNMLRLVHFGFSLVKYMSLLRGSGHSSLSLR